MVLRMLGSLVTVRKICKCERLWKSQSYRGTSGAAKRRGRSASHESIFKSELRYEG